MHNVIGEALDFAKAFTAASETNSPVPVFPNIEG
jgi:hypothetical protein